MTVLQIILGNIPKRLIPCIDSVKKFADRKNYKYICIKNEPEDVEVGTIKTKSKKFNKYAYNRLLSEFLRIDYCAKNKNVLYCDWDIVLHRNFFIPNCETFGLVPDSIFYNHENLNRYRKIKEFLQNKKWISGEAPISKFLWPAMEVENCNHFIPSTYRHLFGFQYQIRKCEMYNYTKY